VLLVVFVLLLSLAGGVFYINFTKDVRALNKKLPEKIRITKDFSGNYTVTNQLDGYKFQVPENWEGIREADYLPERDDEKYSVTSLNVRCSDGLTGAAVDLFKISERESNLRSYVEKIFKEYGLIGELKEQNLNGKNTLSVRETTHLGGDYIYFFESGSGIYAVTSQSEEVVREIINKGNW